jgi:putative aminopeptidase FrvX
MTARGEVTLGGGPGISLYSFHGRGTLNGVIPHPALVALMEDTAEAEGLPLQRSAHTGALTDLSYIQFMGEEGVACLDVGFPMRYTHSALEVVDPADVAQMVTLLHSAIARITPGLNLIR